MSDSPLLPAAARARVVALAAERLSTLAEELVPAALRPYRHFHPRKRAQLAASDLVLAGVADFDDLDALERYQKHPEHKKAGAFIRSVVSDRLAVDLQVA